MADKKISQLTGATTPLGGAEEIPLVQSGATKKVTVADLTVGRSISTAGASLDGAVTINDSGADVDLRVEGDTDANLLFVDASTDRVGVGTSAPGAKVQIQADGVGLRLDGSGDTTRSIFFRSTTAANPAQIYSDGTLRLFTEDAGTDIRFHTVSTGSNNERMRITAGGEVYIAGTSDQGAYNLQVNGTGVWGAGAYVNGSDERIKEDIAPISSGLDVIEKLNPVTYRYKESWSKDQSVQTGFIAQELLTALEGQVYVDGVVQQGGAEDYYSVAYQNIIPILTKAIQEQQNMIKLLEAKVTALENK